VIILGIIKEAIVEVTRWKEDKKVNKTPCTRVCHLGKEETITLSDVKAGDILKIKDGEMIPADCVILCTKN